MTNLALRDTLDTDLTKNEVRGKVWTLKGQFTGVTNFALRDTLDKIFTKSTNSQTRSAPHLFSLRSNKRGSEGAPLEKSMCMKIKKKVQQLQLILYSAQDFNHYFQVFPFLISSNCIVWIDHPLIVSEIFILSFSHSLYRVGCSPPHGLF